MYYIAYNDMGADISDFNIESMIDRLKRIHDRDGDIVYSTTNSLLIDAIRLRVAKDEINRGRCYIY